MELVVKVDMNGLTKKLQAMKAQLEGHDWRGPVGRAMQNVVRSHYIGRGGVFWPRIGKAFARADTDNAVRMKVEGQEAAILQHKIHGGTIRAKTGRMLAIPANPDAKSKGSPSTFSTPALQLAVFGGHAALLEKVGLTNEPNMKAIGAIIANRSSYALANSDDDVEWRMIGGHPVPIKDGQPALEGEKPPSGRVDMTEAESEKYKKEHPVSGWKADKDPGFCDPEAARKEIENGVHVISDSGIEVNVGKIAVEHWNAGTQLERLKDWNRCKLTIQSPEEVWDDGRGITFLKLTCDNNGKKRMISAFTFRRQDETSSWHHESRPRRFEKHRKGKLLYKRPPASEGTHPAGTSRGEPSAGTTIGNRNHTTETLEVKCLEIEAISEGDTDMELEKLAEILGCEATEEAILAAIESLKSAMAEEKPEEEVLENAEEKQFKDFSMLVLADKKGEVREVFTFYPIRHKKSAPSG